MASASLNTDKDQWSDLSIILEFANINSESIQVRVGLVSSSGYSSKIDFIYAESVRMMWCG
jgi:hypothetical protein